MQNTLDPYVLTWEKHNINKTFGCAWPSMKLPRGDHAEVTPIPPREENDVAPNCGNVVTCLFWSCTFLKESCSKHGKWMSHLCQSWHEAGEHGEPDDQPASGNLQLYSDYFNCTILIIQTGLANTSGKYVLPRHRGSVFPTLERALITVL